MRLSKKQFDKWLAIKITDVVSTMNCAYLFAGLALVSLPSAIKGGTSTLVAWTAQTFLQLVLLSVIMVGQKLQTEVHLDTQDQLSTHHELLKEVHQTLKEIK